MKEWKVSIQLGNWKGHMPTLAATAQEAHRMILDAPDALARLTKALDALNVDKDGDGFICAEAMDDIRAALNEAYQIVEATAKGRQEHETARRILAGLKNEKNK